MQSSFRTGLGDFPIALNGHSIPKKDSDEAHARAMLLQTSQEWTLDVAQVSVGRVASHGCQKILLLEIFGKQHHYHCYFF